MKKQTPLSIQLFFCLSLVFGPSISSHLNAQCEENVNNFTLIGSFNNSTYYLSNAPAQAMQAQTQAISMGGNLASINSAAENNYLQSKIDEMVYIGLNDAASEGNLTWENGDALTYTNYDFCNFCNVNDAENDFALIHPWSGGWSFTNRWSQRKYIVEIACDDGGGNGGGECASAISGYQYLGEHNESKYFLSNNTSRPASARSAATQQGGYLVTIDDAAENGFLQDKIEEMVYIGLSDATNEGNLQWLGEGNPSYRNIDQDCGFCQDNDAENDYTVMHPWNGKWSFTNQWSQRKYIMEVPCDGGGNGSLTYTNCPPNRTIQLPAGQTSTFVNWTPPTLASTCTVGVNTNVLISGPNNNSTLSAGSYTVRYRGTNNCGDEAICEFNISIKSATTGGNSSVTFLNCPSDRSIQLAPGQTTAFVNWTAPSVSSSCNAGGLSLGLITGPNNNSNLGVGSYAVKYRASNNCGDVEMCEFIININSGDTPSSISLDCSDDLVFTIPPGSNDVKINYEIPSVTSVCEHGNFSLTRLSGPANNSTLTAGEYTIRHRATNNCGDVAICAFDISIEENNSSTITVNCPDDQTFQVNNPPLAPTALWFFNLPTYNSICTEEGPNGSDGVMTNGAGFAFNQGLTLSPGSFTTADFVAYNLCGDTATCSWTVTTLPPSIPTSIEFNCPADLDLVIPSGANTTVLAFDTPTANNICFPSNSIQIVQTGGPTRNSQVGPGTYTIQYRAINMCNNEEFCSFNVNVTSSGNGGGGNGGNVNYTANDQVTPYTGLFRPGTNVGYNPPWTDEEMANLAAGNEALGVKGIGARSMRPGLYDVITAVYGYDFRLETYEHYASLGMEDLTMIVGFPADWHKDQTDHCGNGFKSAMFRNLYSDIWDDGANGTPYNDDNFYAAYLYEVVSRYGEHVKFWEIWNEPGFDLTGNRGWRQPGDPAGNWWDNDPDPCEYILRAPIEHYVRTLRISWEIIKTLQPDDYVTVAGVGFTSFLDAILRNTDDPNTGGAVTAEYPLKGGAYFDVMGFHSYPDIDGSIYDYDFASDSRVFHRHSDRAAEGITTTKNNYQDILDNYGYTGGEHPQKEWIITEINVPRIPFRADAMSGGEQMQVNYIIKAVAKAMENDVRQMHVYNLGDKTSETEAVTEFDLYGLHKRLTGTNAYSQVRNLEAIAYKSAADFVWGSRYDANRTALMNLPPQLDGAALRMANGRYKYILWAKTTIDQSEFAAGSYTFPASFGYGQVYKREWNFTDTDQVLAINSNNISLSGRPIFITETASNSELEPRLDNSESLHLSVFDILPNPATDEIRLVLESKESDNYLIQIYNAQGALMTERNTFMQKGFSDERFDVSQYVHGMYFIVIQDSHMNSTKVKFIKAEQ